MVAGAGHTRSDSLFGTQALHELVEILADARHIDEICDAALSCLKDLLGVERSSILLFDDDGVMRFRVWRGLSDTYRAAVEGHSPWSRSTVDAQPVTVCDVRPKGSLGLPARVFQAEGIRSLALIPLSAGRRLIGELMLCFPDVHEFTAGEVRTVRTIAAHIAFAIEQHERRTHLETMLASPVIGIAEMDTCARFVAVNQRFSELCGRSEEELLGGLTCFDITHPDDYAETRRWMDSLAQGNSHFVLEKRYLRPDGSVIWVSKTVSAIRDDQGCLTRTIAFVSDVTQQKLTQQDLSASEQRYRELMGALGIAVYTTDAEGRITLYNEQAAEMWGVRPRTGRDLWCGSWRIYTPEGEPIPLDQCPMAIALKENRPVRGVEIMIERPDGRRSTILPHPTPMHDEQGRLVGAVNVLIDITERKQAEAELARAYVLKDQFLSLVSHELRTPISTILGNSILLMKRSDRISDQDKQRAYADIVSQTRKLQENIENLLLITRLDSATLEMEAISLPHLVEEATSVFRELEPDREVRFDFEHVPPALGQETLIALVIQNLLTNAAKYSEAPSPIEVLLRACETGEPEVRVRDYGIGIEQDDLANLFTPFYRSQKAKNVATGMGLGLAVCRRIIEAQGGTIQAEGRPAGGADFYFRLPEATESLT